MVYTNAKDLYKSSIPKARFKGSSLPRYAGGGWLETAGTFLKSDQGQNVMGGLGTVGNYLGMVDGVDGKTNPYLSGAAGALKGAQMGAKFGPLGAGIGAAAGVGLALYKSHQEKQMAAELEAQKLKEEQDRKNRLEAANYESSKAILSTYPTSGVADAGFMMAYGGPTDPPPFDMSLLAGNSLPAPSQLPASEPNVLTGYNDAQLTANRQKGNAIAVQNRADIVGDNLNTAYQYAKENPLDATQIALGSVAIGADGIPLVGNTVSAVADGINAGISGSRAAYYANKGDYGKAAFYTTAAALDGAAAVPGLGNAAGASKIGMLLNKTAHLAHNPIHVAHQVTPGITAYKAANMGSGMLNEMAMGGKIPTQSAHYLAEGGEVIQHAMNDRPDTDQNGDAKQLNSNTSKFVGDSHDAPSQGIGVANDEEARIFSKRLYAPKDLVAKLKKL